MRAERVTIGAGEPPKGGADVWLVRYAPGRQTVQVKDGDNRGKTLERRNIVRQLARLGTWNGHETALVLPAATEPGLATVVLVQARRGGPILAARQAASPSVPPTPR